MVNGHFDLPCRFKFLACSEKWNKMEQSGSHRAIQSQISKRNSVIFFCCKIYLSYIEKKYRYVDNLTGFFFFQIWKT